MSAIGKARLYGGESPATGEDAEIAIDGERLEVRSAAHVHSAPLADLRIREVGTGRLGIELAWDAEASVRAVQVFDESALQALRSAPALLALPQTAAFVAAQRRDTVGRSLGWSALAVLLALPLLLIVLFIWQADRIALAAASRIPIEQEVELGRQAFESMRGTLNLQDDGAAYDVVRSLGERLTQGSKYPYRFHVAKNDAVNAFAMPGGIIVVHTGLIEATRRPEELAGVLAHEVQHVEQRHSMQAMIKELGLRGLWMLVTGDIGSGVVGQAALELTALSFSRDAEAQADERGFDTLVGGGIDPSGMADFFIIMSQQESGAAPPEFLSTHPASRAREAALRRRLSEVSGTQFTPLEFDAWPPRAE